MTKVCRAWATPTHVRVEPRPGVVYELPNPTPEGRTYEPAAMLRAVIAAGGDVDLERWIHVED